MSTGIPEDMLAALGPQPADLEQHIRDLADKLGVIVWTLWHLPKGLPSYVGRVAYSEKKDSAEILMLDPPNTQYTYTAAIHELGHAAQIHARHEDVMVREQRAWLWARWHKMPGVELDEALIAESLEWHRQDLASVVGAPTI